MRSLRVAMISANTFASPDPVFPIGAAIVATACQQAGHEVSCFDCNFKENPEADLAAFLKEKNPEVIGLSLRNIDDTQFPDTTSFIPWYQKLMNLCRENSSAKIILGGSAYSLFPQELLETLAPDFGISGDGEHAFPRLLEQIAQQQDLKTGEKIIFAPRMDLHETAVIPRRDWFDFQRYYQEGGMLNLQSKRGCAFRCSYCTYPHLEGYRLRLRKAGEVADELEFLSREQGIRYFFFVDSVFNYPEDHAADIAKEIIARKLKIRWSAYIRPQMKDPGILKLFKESGCHSVELGTDAMAPETLGSMNKGLTVEEIFRFCEACHEADIEFAHSLIFGAPQETLKTAETTVKNVQATRPTAALAFLGIRVFPHTGIADYCVETGYLKNHQEIGLHPLFYIDRNLTPSLTAYLKEVMKQDRRWIIPGIEAFDLDYLKQYRARKKKGMSWELKKFVDYIG